MYNSFGTSITICGLYRRSRARCQLISQIDQLLGFSLIVSTIDALIVNEATDGSNAAVCYTTAIVASIGRVSFR